MNEARSEVPLTAAVETTLAELRGARDRHGEPFGPNELEGYLLAVRAEAIAHRNAELAAGVRDHVPQVDGYCDSGIYIGCSCGWAADHGTIGWCPAVLALIEGEEP